MRVRTALAAITLTVVAAACGDDDDDAGDDATSAVSPEATPAAETTTGQPPQPETTTVPDPTGEPVPGSPVGTQPPTPDTMTGNEPSVMLTEIGSFAAPVDLAWRAGDGALYIVEQGGTVQRVASDGISTALDVSDLTGAEGERGLLGLAFSPAGDLAYVNYTDLDGNTTITEHPVDADGTFGTGDAARTVLVVEQPYPNHNGGDLTFGPDGMLYIGMGDGGAGGDPERRATNPAELLGKLLRIDPSPSGDQPYSVPPDNPFVGQADAAPEVWASGLRNPWRFSFDRRTGDLWIADVGQDTIEEVDVAPATGGLDAGKGESFGWSALEGDAPYNEDVVVEDPVPPFFTYARDEGCSVSGGVRPAGGPVPDLVGWYVFGDYCSGQLWALEVLGVGASLAPGRQVDLGEVPSLTAVVDGPQGELYALSGRGPVLRLDPAAGASPSGP